VSLLLMRSSIMTEKLARRGTPVRTEYSADFLDRVSVADAATREVVTLNENTALTDVIDWLSTRGIGTNHQGYPVLADDGTIVGVVTRRDLLDPNADETCPVRALIRRGPVVAFEENTLREAADHMVHEKVGRLPVVSRSAPRRLVGIISRSDLLDAHRGRLDAALITEAPPIERGSSDKRLEHFVESRVALVDAALHPRLEHAVAVLRRVEEREAHEPRAAVAEVLERHRFDGDVSRHAVPFERSLDPARRDDFAVAALESVRLTVRVFHVAPMASALHLHAFDVELVTASPPLGDEGRVGHRAPHLFARRVEDSLDADFAIGGRGDGGLPDCLRHRASPLVCSRKSASRSKRASTIRW
jgi:CBS domain-containing protein